MKQNKVQNKNKKQHDIVGNDLSSFYSSSSLYSSFCLIILNLQISYDPLLISGHHFTTFHFSSSYISSSRSLDECSFNIINDSSFIDNACRYSFRCIGQIPQSLEQSLTLSSYHRSNVIIQYFCHKINNLKNYNNYMDDYIKRKRRDPIKVIDPIKESEQQIKTRQIKNQLADLAIRIATFEERTKNVKKQLASLTVKINEQQVIAHNKLLEKSSMQESSIKNQIFDRNTQNTNIELQQTQKLGRTQVMANQRAPKPAVRQQDNTNNEELQQLSKGARGKRKIKF